MFKRALLSCCCLAILGTLPAEAGCLDDIKAAGVLRSGNGAMGLKPSVWQGDDGQLHGFEWEIFQELGKRIGVPKVEYEVTDWTSLIPGLKAGRWDIILSAMSVTQERIQGAGIEYTRPYFMLYDEVIVPGNSSIKTMNDLKGKILATTLGTMDSVNAHAMVDEGKAGSVLDFNTFGEPFMALQNGQADAVILDQGTFYGQKENMPDLRVVGDPIFYHPKPEWAEAEAKAPYILGGTAIGVRRECGDLLEALNKALADMDADGTRKAIISKYGVWSAAQEKMMK
ncbi:amino acid ABC transporter substrate-binding protein, PAAT family [Arboricoccus pini]|uniref:Amino acid ABC transporter substrate-binding protein, PAAT family n=1 Tax=Arboricoccus pini TaxID=1963835 RepID=A0A212RR52_9PROT|nr:transporter substrate-binding domain-containing protein [Arboricoccus pini]SNB74903.1 amino acid ABC transporter substrate-binding protein, PAAT family [Arboricoccus pini]